MTISELFPYQKKALKNVSATVTALRESDIKALENCRNEAAKETVKGIVKLGVYLAGSEVLDSLTAETPLEGLKSLSAGTVFKAVDCLAIAGNAISCVAATVMTVSAKFEEFGNAYQMAQEPCRS